VQCDLPGDREATTSDLIQRPTCPVDGRPSIRRRRTGQSHLSATSKCPKLRASPWLVRLPRVGTTLSERHLDARRLCESIERTAASLDACSRTADGAHSVHVVRCVHVFRLSERSGQGSAKKSQPDTSRGVRARADLTRAVYRPVRRLTRRGKRKHLSHGRQTFAASSIRIRGGVWRRMSGSFPTHHPPPPGRSFGRMDWRSRGLRPHRLGYPPLFRGLGGSFQTA